ncbi:Uncharacterized protein Rs2_15372 [Raphanus sativus]|nr:Uncharacterized protein Rs2_15372 [Raphanus sativus]
MVTIFLLMLLDFGVFSLLINNNDESSPMDLSYFRRAATERGEEGLGKRGDQWTEVLSWEPRAFVCHNFLKLGGPSVSDYKKLHSEKSDFQIKYNEVFAKHQGTLRENFYMIGWNGNGVYRVLKIERLDASELNLRCMKCPRMRSFLCEILAYFATWQTRETRTGTRGSCSPVYGGPYERLLYDA